MAILNSPDPPPTDRTIAIVAPQWLQDGLAVLVKTIPSVRLVACTGSIFILLLHDLDRAPDVIILAVTASEAKAGDQVRQVKFVHPHARYLVLIQEQAQTVGVRIAGADETLLQGASSEQFTAAITRLVHRQEPDKTLLTG